MLAAANALMPLHLGASSAPSAAHATVQKIPAGLARAIHVRLGPGPLGLGTAPLVSGIAPAHSGWSVKAPSQSIAAHISRAGTASVSLRGSASASLEAVSLSAGSTRETLSATSSALTRGRLVQRLGAVQSQQQVTKAGLEQQFVIAHPPVKAAKSLTLALGSSQRWRVVRGGSAIQVLNSHLVYGGLRTTDATGRVLPSHFVVTNSGPQIVVDSRGATYPVTIDPTWSNSSTPTATLIGSDGVEDTDFGYSVALSADDTTAIVGAYHTNLTGSEVNTETGAVYIYHVASVNDWSTTSTPSANLSDPGLDGVTYYLDFGYSVALSGDGTTALIGAPGSGPNGSAAYIYQVASESSWASTAAPTATLFDGTGIKDGFGDSVALSSNGKTALIGAPLGSGVAYPYGDAYLYQVASETSWASTATPTATLTSGLTTADDFGYSVAVSANGTTALIGSRFNAAYIFQVASVTDWASTASPTATLSNGVVDGEFGYSVALSGDGTTALVGAPSADLSGANGAAYVFQASGGNVWASSSTPVATLTSGLTTADNFGNSVALSSDGTTALIGAFGVSNNTGAAYIFNIASESAWSSNATPSPTATLTNGGGATNDSFGSSLILSPDGTTALISAVGGGGTAALVGTGYIYHTSSESAWSSSSTPVAIITDAGNTLPSTMGYSVALSADGTTALVGYASPDDVNTVYIFHTSSEGTWSSSAASVATLTNDVEGDQTYGSSIALSADGTTAFVGDIGANSNSGAVYVYQVSSESDWSSSAPLVATLTDASAPGGSFGWGIALSADGTTALIGNGLFGSGGDGCELTVVGDAFVFHVSSESAWSSSSTPNATLSDGGTVGDCFGSAVALSANGTTALIGAYSADGLIGDAFVFHVSSESDWSSSSAPAATLTDATAAWFGWSVALSADGSTALIGAPATEDGGADYTGAAFIFTAPSQNAWSSSLTPTATLSGGGPNELATFGWSVTLSADGTTALIGGNGTGGAGRAGAVFVFNASSESAWSTSSTPASTLFNSTTSLGNFGWAVALSEDGTTALIGDSNGGAFIYGNTSAAITTPDGAGTMTVSPTSVVVGSKNNSLTFTYSASGGALNDGTIDIAVPEDWSPASIPIIDISPGSAGLTTSNCGPVSLGNTAGDGEGYTIEVTGVTLADGATCTITYGTPTDAGGFTAVAPSSPTTSTFTTSTASTATGILTNIATSPVVSVKSSTQVITMAPTTYTTLAQSGTYNVGATTNDTDPGATITYGVSASDLDSAGCSVDASGKVSFTGAGVCTIDANAGATTNFVASPQVQQLINVYVVIPTDTITFNSDGGSAVNVISGPRGSTITLPGAPTLVGSTFDGWGTQPPGEGGTVAKSPYTLTGSLTLYAQWTPINEIITFDSEGGSSVSGWEGYYGSTITLPTAPTFTGFTFDGWFVAPSGGTALTSPYTLTASVTLYAQWTPTSGFDLITFDSEGGSAVDSVGAAQNSTIPLPAAPTLTGSIFDGWFLAPSGGTALTSPYALTSSLILYAQWTPTVITDAYSYNTAGGSTAPSGGSGTDGTSILLAGPATKTNFTFAGWSDGTTTYGAGASYVLNSDGAAIVFTAQWTPNSTVTPTVAVIYPVNGSTYGTNWSGVITGSASAKGGTTISSVKVAIENTTTGKWWNGISFSTTIQLFEAATGTTSWSFALPAGDLVSGDAYSVTAQATDSNSGIGTSSPVTFTYATPSMPISTTTSLSIVPPFVTYGFERVETFVVTVTGTKGILPTGTVSIKLGSTTLCSMSSFSPSRSGSITATCNLTDLQLPVGDYSVGAVYSGDVHYAGSTSGARGLRVTKDRTRIKVSVSPSSVTYGNESAAIFTATVSTGNGAPVPNGETVTVNVGPATCTVVLNGGTGTCTISNSALAPGIYPISTTYDGDVNLSGDSSSFWTSLVVKHSSRHVARESIRRRSNVSKEVNDSGSLRATRIAQLTTSHGRR